jgi:hypothetical protein
MFPRDQNRYAHCVDNDVGVEQTLLHDRSNRFEGPQDSLLVMDGFWVGGPDGSQLDLLAKAWVFEALLEFCCHELSSLKIRRAIQVIQDPHCSIKLRRTPKLTELIKAKDRSNCDHGSGRHGTDCGNSVPINQAIYTVNT